MTTPNDHARARLEELRHVPYLTADMARSILPPDPAPPVIVDGQILLNAGPSERGWHRAQTMLVCPQLWAYKHHPDLAGDERIQHVRYETSPPLVRGSLLHVGLAHFYRRVQALQTGQDVDLWHTPARAIEILAAVEDNRPHNRDAIIRWGSFVPEAVAAVSAYTKHWRSQVPQKEILGVEYPLRLLVPAGGWSTDPAVDAFLLTLRVDVMWWETDGYSRVIDHKTRGRRDPRQERGYARDGQFQALRLIGESTFGRFFGGVQTNYVTYKHSPDIRVFGAAGDYAFSFERQTPPVLGRRIETFGDTIRWAEYQEQAFLGMSLDPFRFPKVNVGNGACEHRYGPCPGAYLCDYGPDGIPFGAVGVLPNTHDGKDHR